MIEPKPTAVAVGVFCLPVAMKGAILHQTGAKALVRLKNEPPRKSATRSKTRRRGALLRSLGGAKGGKQKSPHPQTRAGERGRRRLGKITRRHTERCGNASEPGALQQVLLTLGTGRNKLDNMDKLLFEKFNVGFCLIRQLVVQGAVGNIAIPAGQHRYNRLHTV
jgi:hypothetical protein